MATLRTGKYGIYYGSLYSESEPLSQTEMNVNAKYVYSYLSASGWSINAISALLGNMQAESSINPGRWQSENVYNNEGGYGLVQWTPATKYFDWCFEQVLTDPSEMDNNLARIVYEANASLQWISTDTYAYSFKEFSNSSASVEELAKAFLLCYERPADQSESVQAYRASLANAWFEVLTGETPNNPLIFKKRKYNFLLFNARKRRQTWINRNF